MHTFPTNQLLDLCLSLKTHLHGKQVSGKTLSSLYIEQTLLSTGSVDLYSPELSEGNKQIATLMENPLNIVSNEIRVGLGTTLSDNRI